MAFKQRFYPGSWARYDQAKPGTLRLVPDSHVLATLETDYRAMSAMIFGEVPSFNQILDQLRDLEGEINRR